MRALSITATRIRKRYWSFAHRSCLPCSRRVAYTSSADPLIKPSHVPTNVKASFQVPLTLADVHLRHEQLPFCYFFEETLDAEQLCSSLERTLKRYPIIGGRLSVKDVPVIQCQPGNSIPMSFANCQATLQEWRRRHYGKQHQLASGQEPRLLALFDALQDNLASIKITYFRNGGTAIGVNTNHLVADAASCFRLVECWGREMQGLDHPKCASNDRSMATVAGMISPAVAELLDMVTPVKTDAYLGVDADAHEYVILKFSPEVLRAMKAHGMASCADQQEMVGGWLDYFDRPSPPPTFVSVNDLVTGFGWLLKCKLSGQDWSISMVVNLRGRSGVDAFSDVHDKLGEEGVFGNGITNVIAQLPSDWMRTSAMGKSDVSSAARSIRRALTKGLEDVGDRVSLSRMGRAAARSVGPSFATTSWHQFPVWNIGFSSNRRLLGFHAHPSHPLPLGPTFSSVIVPEKCGSLTYQLLAPKHTADEAHAIHKAVSDRFLSWHAQQTAQ